MSSSFKQLKLLQLNMLHLQYIQNLFQYSQQIFNLKPQRFQFQLKALQVERNPHAEFEMSFEGTSPKVKSILTVQQLKQLQQNKQFQSISFFCTCSISSTSLTSIISIRCCWCIFTSSIFTSQQNAVSFALFQTHKIFKVQSLQLVPLSTHPTPVFVVQEEIQPLQTESLAKLVVNLLQQQASIIFFKYEVAFKYVLHQSNQTQ
ncbi:unnamed protein product [Paramecium sonneborni]|uniref:Uncharacterized protein n=1 Tax=Paramecium sonneborni TaxID=65129 RepID=A0A8S1RV46_9CILI|nr:unnamed protein product [Paramecium sonneborni]